MSEKIEVLIKRQRDYFVSGKTARVSFRLQALDRLEKAILKYEEEL